MAQRRVTLVANAREKAQDLGVNVGILQDEARYEALDSKEVVVSNRDFHLLQEAGLLQDNKTELVHPAADQPEAEDAADHVRTNTKDRGPHGTDRGVAPGGTGHQDGDGYGPDRIQDEIKRDQARGLAQQKEKGLGSPRDHELETNLVREGRSTKAGDEEKARAKQEREDRKAARARAHATPKGEQRGEGAPEPQGETLGTSKAGAVRDEVDPPKSGDRKDQRTGQNPDKGAGAEVRADDKKE